MVDNIVKDTGSYCGYCNSVNGFISHGIWVFNLSPENYQNLINKGWRRSGSYLYKPIVKKTCCPMYPIRCDILKFQLSKSQRKILRKINKRFPLTSEFHKEGPKGDERNNGEYIDFIKLLQKVITNSQSSICNKSKNRWKSEENLNLTKTNLKKVNSDCCVNYLNTKTINESFNNSNYCGERLNSIGSSVSLEIKLENRQYKSKKMQSVPFEELIKSNNIKINIIPNLLLLCDEDRLREEFNLFKIYQSTVHKDKMDQLNITSFREFLISSPLTIEKSIYGSFHMQYRLNDQLMGVSVIDILPNCVSSVYFFYNPEYSKYSLGVYSILCEINMVQKLHNQLPQFRYHYSGYYIHNCQKMNYKANFKPAYLCCPTTNNWIEFDTCKLQLDSTRFCSQFDWSVYDKSRDPNKTVEDEFKIVF